MLAKKSGRETKRETKREAKREKLIDTSMLTDAPTSILDDE